MNNIKDRIALIIEYKELNSSKFADLVDIQRSRMSHIMSGRNNPSIDVVVRIVEKFPEISTDWLINGKGNMLIESEKVIDFSSLDSSVDEFIEEEIPIDLKMETNPGSQNSFEKTGLPFRPPSNGKPVDRIIVFYTDDSFKEYRPE
ncbi:MAG: helix-turn-helix transcriptional regulator [Marinifilaceae bacterium]